MTRQRREVHYLHHTRDADGDVVLFFTQATGAQPLRSSPVVGVKRLRTAVIDLADKGDVCRYLVATEHTDYEVSMSRERAAHLAQEVGLPAPD